MNQQTPPGVTYLVIWILGVLAVMCIGTMCACAIMGIQIQEALMTALISLGGTLSGAVGTLLVNTRSQPTPIQAEMRYSESSPATVQPVAK